MLSSNNKDCVSWADLVPLCVSFLFVTQNEEQFIGNYLKIQGTFFIVHLNMVVVTEALSTKPTHQEFRISLPCSAVYLSSCRSLEIQTCSL
jgi:hypothetical protein